MTYFNNVMNLLCSFFHSFPETFVNIWPQAIVSYLCFNLIITPVFIACQTQLMLSVFSVLFFFINVAVILILLGLEYLGLAVLLVYAGAIIMILLFIIMLVKLQETEKQPFSILSPSRWTASTLPIQEKHIKARSIFLIMALLLGAAGLTYSCKSVVYETLPFINPQEYQIAPSLNLYTLYSNPADYSCTSVHSGYTKLEPTYQPALFDTCLVTSEPNYMPWLFSYFNLLLETKFQPIVLENGENNSWPFMMLDMAPSYNLDRWTLNLVSQMGKLHEILPAYSWSKDLIDVSKFPSTGNPSEHIYPLIKGELISHQWEFYPRTRPWVYDYPALPMEQLLKTKDIPLIYATELELKDQIRFPINDISNISSTLYTKHSATLVLASVCLFIAMVLSFLLTDFKVRK